MANLQIILYLTVFAVGISSAGVKSVSDVGTKWPTELKKTVKFFEQMGNMSEDRIDLVIQHDGYPVEMHNVTTKDGYIITCARIPRGKNKSTANKKPVMIMPGFSLTAASWLSVSPQHALPYLLADRGYDVWLPTYRGNKISSRHVKYTQKDKKYWDFSMDEIGMYDISAVVDLMLKQSGMEKLSVICYSLGCPFLYILLTTKTTYNKKVQKIVNLAPSVYVSNVKSPRWQQMGQVPKLIKALPGAIRPVGAVPNSHNVFNLLAKPCGTSHKFKLCTVDAATKFGIYSGKSNDLTAYKLRSVTKPRLGWKMVQHLLQFATSEIFRRFHYGGSENKKIYGTVQPPKYDLALVKVPFVLTIQFPADELVVEKDARRLNDELPASIHKKFKVVDDPKFAHGDVMLHDNVKKLVFNDVIKFLDENN